MPVGEIAPPIDKKKNTIASQTKVRGATGTLFIMWLKNH